MVQCYLLPRLFSDVKANEQSGKPSIPFLLFSCLFLSLPYSTQHHYNQPCNEHTDKDKKVFFKKEKDDRLKQKSMKGASIPLPKNISLSPKRKGKRTQNQCMRLKLNPTGLQDHRQCVLRKKTHFFYCAFISPNQNFKGC